MNTRDKQLSVLMTQPIASFTSADKIAFHEIQGSLSALEDLLAQAPQLNAVVPTDLSALVGCVNQALDTVVSSILERAGGPVGSKQGRADASRTRGKEQIG